MSLEQRDGSKPVDEVLADLTNEPVDEFEYDGDVPDPAEQDWEDADAE